MWPHPIPGDHDYNKFESTLSEDASTQAAAFLAHRFKKKILKYFLNIFFCEISSLTVAHPIPGDHDLQKLEYTLPEMLPNKFKLF